MESRSRSIYKWSTMLISALLFLFLIHGAHCFYLPGVTPEDFQKGDPLKEKLSKLASIKTQLPYSYYSLPFCTPEKIVDCAENLGEVLRGDRIENSPHAFNMQEPQHCAVLCRITLDAKTAKQFKEKIDDEYRVNMILDNLPLAVPIRRLYQFLILFISLATMLDLKANMLGTRRKNISFTTIWHLLSRRKNILIFYSRDGFQESDVKWASRWDSYLLMSDDQIRWFSIVNSLMIVLFLSGMVAVIMLRTLYRDISKYNEFETQEEALEETGWKLLHGDVFRPSSNFDLLCVYVGTGVQFLGMVLVTMIFAVLGFLSPSNLGGLMTAMLLLWVFMGIFPGYASTLLYKMFKGAEWKKIALRTACMFPDIVFVIFFVLNALICGRKSSGAVPFETMFALVFPWFGISFPLVFVGGYVGFKKPAMEDPEKNKIPRQIPEQAWYMNPIFSVLIGGILPFGAVFIELFFILTSIWLNQFYYIFGFLFLVFIIVLITCAEIIIVLCYFQLCSEDYKW